MHFECHFFPYIQDQIFKNGGGHQSDKNQHIAKKSTTRMRDPLGTIPMKYKKNPLKTVGGDTF